MEKRYLYSFILLFSVSFNLNADICDFLYRPNLRQTLSPDLKLIAKLNRIEGRIKLLRKFSKKSPTGNSLYHESIKLEFKTGQIGAKPPALKCPSSANICECPVPKI